MTKAKTQENIKFAIEELLGASDNKPRLLEEFKKEDARLFERLDMYMK